MTDPIYDDSIFDTDYIYLTHWHFDDFHETTLERFKKKSQFFVPKFPVSYIETNLYKLGFENITEMVHTKLYTLDNGLGIRSFQVSPQDDSVIAVSSPDLGPAGMEEH